MKNKLQKLEEKYLGQLTYNDDEPISKCRKLALWYATDVLKEYTKSQIKQGGGGLIDYLSERLELEPDIELCFHFPTAKVGGIYRIKEYPNIYVSPKSIAYKYSLLTTFTEDVDAESVYKCLTDLHNNAEKVIDTSIVGIGLKLKSKIETFNAKKKIDQLNESIAKTILDRLIPKNIARTWVRYQNELKLYIAESEVTRWGKKRPADLQINLDCFMKEQERYKKELLALVAREIRGRA